jgi:hypothetical protein
MPVTRDYVQGYLDRGCHVHPGSNAIEVSALDDTILLKIYAWLRSQGFHARVRRETRGRTVLRIGGLESLQKYRKELGFLDPQKQDALDDLLDRKRDDV